MADIQTRLNTNIQSRVRRDITTEEMRDEVFDINVEYKEETIRLTVKTDYPVGPQCMDCDYDVFQGRKHLYTISQCKNEDEIECWEVKRKPASGHDPEFALLIGKAIDEHYN